MTMFIYRHAGGLMPCPVCQSLASHIHEMTEAEFKALARKPDFRLIAYEPSPFAIEVMAERQRQQDVQGFGPRHDQRYLAGELVKAAVCYALYSWVGIGPRTTPPEGTLSVVSVIERLWPWDWTWFRPRTKRRALVKAAALLLAEGDRQDYAERLAAEKLEAQHPEVMS